MGIFSYLGGTVCLLYDKRLVPPPFKGQGGAANTETLWAVWQVQRLELEPRQAREHHLQELLFLEIVLLSAPPHFDLEQAFTHPRHSQSGGSRGGKYRYHQIIAFSGSYLTPGELKACCKPFISPQQVGGKRVSPRLWQGVNAW